MAFVTVEEEMTLRTNLRDLNRVPRNDVIELVPEDETEEGRIRALVDSVLDNPENIQLFQGEPEVMEHVYARVLNRASGDLLTFFTIALESRSKELFLRLVKKAIDRKESDALAYLLLKHAGDLAVRFLGRLVARLTPFLELRTCVHILRASNPCKSPRLNEAISVDMIWKRIINIYVAQGNTHGAYLALITAGRGLRADEYDLGYLSMPARKRCFIQDMKDWRSNDAAGWRTYGRASPPVFVKLIPAVWLACSKAGQISSEPVQSRGVSALQVKVLVRSGDMTTMHTREKRIDFSGLIGRFIQGKAQTEKLVEIPIYQRPVVDRAQLSLVGSMLQDLVIHHSPREIGVMARRRGGKDHKVVTILDLLRDQD